MNRSLLAFVLAAAYVSISGVTGFTPPASQSKLATRFQPAPFTASPFRMSKEDEVVELTDDEPTEGVEEKTVEENKVVAPFLSQSEQNKVVAPFLSQGEISEEPVDLSDPKQARVMFYIILSLLPVLFLIPLMLGSRDLLPQDILPPVDI
jgi:hypothetical protein